MRGDIETHHRARSMIRPRDHRRRDRGARPNPAYWHGMDQPGRPDDVRCWSKSGKHLFFQRISPFDPQATLVTPDKDQGDPNGHEARKICDDGQKGDLRHLHRPRRRHRPFPLSASAGAALFVERIRTWDFSSRKSSPSTTGQVIGQKGS